MSESGDKLRRRQERSIQALLQEPTVALAAKAAKVGESTLWRYLADPDFLGRYRLARRSATEAAVALAQQAAAEAITTLRQELAGARAADRIRAALALVDIAVRGVELVDLAQRVEAIERAQKAAKGPAESGVWG